jgi:nucleoside-diphosphate-sugar epimerase
MTDLPGVRRVIVPDIGPETDWAAALDDCDAVVHCAARVHVMGEREDDPGLEFRRVNVSGSRALAEQAVRHGVRRFVYLSSIKVNGEATELGRPFLASDRPNPRDLYGHSKRDAEQALQQLAAHDALDLTIIRPPLVYGPGVKANFRSIAQLVANGVPLPLGAVTSNRRSFVALDNLVDLIACCLNHHAAVGEVFLVSDGVDLSTADLLRRIAAALGVSARLLPVPPLLLQTVARLLRRESVWQRLTGSLQVDVRHTFTCLDWSPPVAVDHALRSALADVRRSPA